jgi:hypothetical protein
VNVNNTVSCDDSDVCTTADVCAGGACAGGPALDCDDGDECTADSCDEITGCGHDPIIGCGEIAVPATDQRGIVILALLVAVSGVVLNWRWSDNA